MEKGASDDSDLARLNASLQRIASGVPGSIRFRLLNTLEHFKRAFELIDIDREMASFRAITGQEEAATALMLAIVLRRYPRSELFNPRDHRHKAAILACVTAIKNDIAPVLLAEFQVIFDFGKKRIDVKVPLSNFNIEGGESYALQPVEPLDVVHTKPGTADGGLFDQCLANLARQSQFDDIKRFVAAQANARNTLLYASDSALPRSKATHADIQNRQWSAITLLMLSIMVLQSRKHQTLVRDAITAFLSVIARLPKEEPN